MSAFEPARRDTEPSAAFSLAFPHIEVEGAVVDRTGRRINVEPILRLAGAHTFLRLNQPAQFAVPPPAGPVTPPTILSMSAAPHASASGGARAAIRINLGLILAAAALPVIGDLVDRLMRQDRVSLDELGKWTPPTEAIREVDQLFQCWRTSELSGWAELMVPSLDLTNSPFVRQLACFVVQHEVAHWLEGMYAPQHWQRLMAITETHVRDWLSASHSGAHDEAAPLLNDREVLEHWKREVCADATAFHACLISFGGGWDPRLRRSTYAAVELTYFMLRLLEVYYRRLDMAPSPRLHPPANARRELLAFIRAREMKLSLSDFITREYGAGIVVAATTERIIDAYLHWPGATPLQR